jgi:outer membrane lipase/esterase
VLRHPRSRAWARSAISAATLALAVAGLSTGAAAEEKHGSLFVFGDSYADVTLSDRTASNSLAQPNPFVVPPFGTLPPGIGLSLWRVYPVPLAANLGIPHSQIQDIAVGGATATPFGSPDPVIVPAPIAPGNLSDQVRGFLAENPAFGPRDLVTISIGGNDGIGFVGAAGNDVDGARAFGGLVATLTTAEIQKLIGVGARTFVIAGFTGMSNLGPEFIPDAVEGAADAYANAYFNGLQANLLSDAQKGTRFFMLDLFKLGAQAVVDSRYGFKVTNGESRCPSPAECPVNGPDSTDTARVKYVLGPDGLHLTSDGFQLVADYMANIVMAPDTIAVQPGIVTTTTSGFVSSLFGRLDATRVTGYAASASPDGSMGLGATEKSRGPQAAPSSGRFTSYAMGTFLGGSRSDSTDVVGYDYDSVSGTAGIEYSMNRNLLLGVAANYTTLGADLQNSANVDLDGVQAAAYLSYATRNIFADALVAYGSHDLDLNRPGAVDFKPISSSTDASALALAARAGYLLDLGSLRAGPIAGLTYIHTRVGGYSEKGDDLATFNVSSQTLDSLTGNLGLRFLAPFKAADGSIVVPYLNVMLEHQFGDDSRTLTVDQVQTGSFLPILTSFPNFDTRTYGRVEGGVTLQLTPDLSASITGASTFARDDGQDYRVSAGLNYRF